MDPEASLVRALTRILRASVDAFQTSAWRHSFSRGFPGQRDKPALQARESLTLVAWVRANSFQIEACPPGSRHLEPGAGRRKFPPGCRREWYVNALLRFGQV